MELEQLIKLTGNIPELVGKVQATRDKADAGADMYEVVNHDITKTAKRPDKIIKDSDGKDQTVYVSRLPLPLQKKIVNMAAAFLCGNPIEMSCTPEEGVQTDLRDILKRIWDDNKLDYDSKNIAKLMMSRTEAAEIWYTEPAEENYWKGTANEGINLNYRFRVKIVSPADNDLYPVFDSRDDMIAFGRGYKVKEGEEEFEYFDLYTAGAIYYARKGKDGWAARQEPGSDGVLRDIAANFAKGKIPVIYYTQPAVEWADVQNIIDRFEKLISNHADTNDYFTGPTVVVEGKVLSFAKKGEAGKLIELEPGAKASYLTWDQSPESLALEFKNLRSLIFDLTDTPDISIEQMKSLGTYSGIALKMLFLNAHLKAADKEENFGKAIQRRFNLMKAMVAVLNPNLEPALTMSIKPKFTYFLPKNELEYIQMIGEAKAGGFLSAESATKQNPIVEDGEAEWKKILAEKESAAIDPAGLNNEMNNDTD